MYKNVKMFKRVKVMRLYDRSIMEFINGKWQKLEGVYQ